MKPGKSQYSPGFAKSLRESENNYRLLIENLQEGIWAVDQDGYTTYVNKPMAEMLGYTVEKMLGTHLSAYMDEKSMEAVEQNLQRRPAGMRGQYEFQFVKKDGRRLYVTLETGPIIDEKGYHSGAIAGMQDITRRKLAEQALQESEQKFRAAFEGSHDAITVVTKEGRFVDCNERTLELFGLQSKDAFYHARPGTFSPPFQQDQRSSAKLMQDYISMAVEKGVSRFEWLHQRKNGEIFPAEVILTSYRSGTDIMLQASIRDITERKKVEKQLAEKNTTLSLLNSIALEQAALQDYDGLIELMLTQLKKNTGAVAVAFSKYCKDSKALLTKKIKTERKLLDTAMQVGCKNIMNMVTPISAEIYREITSSLVGFRSTLTEATQGAVPPSVSAAIQRISGIDCVVGLAHMAEGQLYGVSAFGLKKGHPVPSRDFLESFAHISAISLRRLQAEKIVADYSLELEQLYLQLDQEINRELTDKKNYPGKA